MQNPDMTGILKRAKNFKNICENIAVRIDDGEVIVGAQSAKYRATRAVSRKLRPVAEGRGREPVYLHADDRPVYPLRGGQGLYPLHGRFLAEGVHERQDGRRDHRRIFPHRHETASRISARRARRVRRSAISAPATTQPSARASPPSRPKPSKKGGA